MRDLHLARFIKPFTKWFTISHAIAMTATLMNPLIYAFMNMTFRDEFARVAPEFHLFGKFCHNLLFCRRDSDVDKVVGQQQLGRPLLDMNRVKRVSLREQKNGQAEMQRFSICSHTERPKNMPLLERPSTNETTPNQNSPIDI
jgi:hypothetical protein